MDTNNVQIISKALDSPEFRSLWSSFNRRYIPWDQFQHMPMPKDLNAEHAWRIIAGLRKGAGTVFKYPPWFPFDQDGEIWFSTTREDEARMYAIVAQTSGGSKLAHSIAKLDGYYFSQYLMMSEFLTACSLDGIELASERARQIAYHAAEPTTDAERVFVNLCTTFSDSRSSFKDREVTHGLIEDIHRKLLDGIEGTLPHIAPSPMADQTYYTSERVLDLICRLGKCEGANNALHPILAYIEISRMLWDLQPLSTLNACVEVIVRKIFFTNQGFPGCAYLETANIDQKLREDKYTAIGFRKPLTGYSHEYQLFGIDGTLYHSVILEHYVEELEHLANKVNRFSIRRAQEKTRVNAIEGLNERERDVIMNLLRNPLHKATIEYHQQRHHTSYATARSDLVHLEELGYLTMNKDGRKFAYAVGSKLIDLA